MWKEDRNIFPVSDIRHLTIDNLKFAINLRKDQQVDHSIKNASAVKKKSSSHPAAAKLEEQSKELSKETGCKHKHCLQAEEDLLETTKQVREENNLCFILFVLMPDFIFFMIAT